MRLTAFSAEQFRNIKQLSFTPSPYLNVIYGQNGQGKTNLLEGIWLLTGGKSFRGGKDVELIRRSQPFATIHAGIQSSRQDEPDSLTVQLVRSLQSPGRASRSMGKNGSEPHRASLLAGVFPAVVFAPVHLHLVKGGPEGRRRFLDAALCQLYPGYLEHLRRYTRLVTQKNALLKQENAPGEDILEIFDVQLAEIGSLLIKKRKQYVTDIARYAVSCYEELSAGRERFLLSYLPCVCEGEDPAAFLKALRQARQKDRYAGFSTCGPHRDDLLLQIDGEDAKIWASQGQQRSAVLALKIAEAMEIEEIAGEMPVLLLDDVLSELDASRQDFLLNRMEKQQVFVTSCETDLFTKTHGLLFHMEHGTGSLQKI